ncbi:hypothetical protein [Aeromonas phage 14AhydR10PP]|nr:hypothetical protein [Aeromonas phage 14AhydR10PP]
MSKQVIAGVTIAQGEVSCGVKSPAYDPISPEVPTFGEYWSHTAMNGLPEMTWDAFQARMMNQYGLTILYRSMADDPEVDWEDELEIESWEPQNPFVSDRAFLLVLGEDEDGPFTVWGLPQ